MILLFNFSSNVLYEHIVPRVLHAIPITSSLSLSPWYCLLMNTNYDASHCVTFPPVFCYLLSGVQTVPSYSCFPQIILPRVWINVEGFGLVIGLLNSLDTERDYTLLLYTYTHTSGLSQNLTRLPYRLPTADIPFTLGSRSVPDIYNCNSTNSPTNRSPLHWQTDSNSWTSCPACNISAWTAQ